LAVYNARGPLDVFDDIRTVGSAVKAQTATAHPSEDADELLVALPALLQFVYSSVQEHPALRLNA
jgi:hypothetical protein